MRSQRARAGVMFALPLAMAAYGAAMTLPRTPAAYHGTVTFALPPGQALTYIFPLQTAAVISNVNYFQVDALLYRPLYWFGTDGKPTINYAQSVGRAPSFSNGGRTVTVNLNRYMWSDGRPVTNRDVQFWMDLLIANKTQWASYVPGGFPDNVVAMHFPASHPYRFSLTFNRKYNPTWVLSNQLSQIIPVPQQAWDRESTSGAVGNYDTTHAGAGRVYRFLNAQSELTTKYPTNPLWAVVDGPWRLTGFDPATGFTTFEPNPSYSGPDKPRLAKFEEVPFTTDTAEFNALRAGSLDYGYIPAQDSSQRSYFENKGYRVSPWPAWGFNSIYLNYTNKQVGPLFNQLYIRQALQRLIDQPALISHIYHGTAYPQYGWIPIVPASPYISPQERRNPYPFSVRASRTLLASHGWSVKPNRVDVCTRPGTGRSDCGAGIPSGTHLQFTMQYTNGSTPFTAQAETLKSDWSLAGVALALKPVPVSTLFSIVVPCDPQTNTGCQWQIGDIGAPGSTATFSPGYLPTGDIWLETGASFNFSGYSNPTMDALIRATTLEGGLGAFYKFENYAQLQLPELWQPNFYYQISVVAKALHGDVFPQDPNLNIYPQTWYLGR